MAVALVALFLSLGGVGIAATGGSFILGHSNEASKPTSLTASPAKGAALVVRNATSGGSAAAFRVNPARQPFTVNSSAEVQGLNADLLDGVNSNSFEPKSAVVRIYDPYMNFGDTQSWDIGPLVTLTASCSSSGGATRAILSLLNNTPSDGWYFRGDDVEPGGNGAAAASTGGIIVHSGTDNVVGATATPAASPAETPLRIGTLIWWDRTGETITVSYYVHAWAHYCEVEGTSIRAT
jgi:hypothetical protein